MTIELTSKAFKAGEMIPKRYTGDGEDQSPPLSWSQPPSGTESFALICDDPDAPRGTWVHWVLFNLSPGARGLVENVPDSPELPSGAKQGKNDFGAVGYGGPAPPKGKPHRYFFKLYALANTLDLPAGAMKADLDAAMAGKILDQGQLMGTYQR